MTEQTKKTCAELAELLLGCPPKGSVWKHSRTGGTYVVTDCAIAEATQTPLVLYEPFEFPVTMARPLAEWEETVEVNGQSVPRFVRACPSGGHPFDGEGEKQGDSH